MEDNSVIVDSLQNLGLAEDEVKIYLSLLKGQKSHLAVSRDTAIARSNVYRLVDGLIEKGIVHEITTESDKLLEAADPNTLEILIVQLETSAEQKRDIFNHLLPALKGFINQDKNFAIKNYSGVPGLKQMLWNELSTKGEICIFSCGNLNKATGKTFAEKFRLECITRGIKQRAIENPDSGNLTASEHKSFEKHYELRFIDRKELDISPEISIHDDIVSIYNNWANNTRIGTEIKNPFFSTFMRQVFEYYWGIAKPK